MSRKLMLISALVIVAVAVAVTGGIAIAGGVGGDDQPLTGTSLEQASTAALAHTGGGEVTEAEVGDDGAAYEVEVRLADGRSVEVQLDAQYQVTGEEADDDDGGAADEQDESESEEEGSD